MIPTSQATAAQPSAPTGQPRKSARTVSMISVSGWCVAKARSQPGMLLVGTNALLAKVISGLHRAEVTVGSQPRQRKRRLAARHDQHVQRLGAVLEDEGHRLVDL